jgi:N-acyl homoserine lactone hydrolase
MPTCSPTRRGWCARRSATSCSAIPLRGDGTVIIKAAPGHSPGHQVLFLKLKKTGPVVLSGDLYHYPEERKLGKIPTTEFNARQTAASRAEVEAFLKKTGAQLWIQHDLIANQKLKKSPAFYE